MHERERRCVTWHLEEDLRDAAHVGDHVVVLNTNGTIAGVDPSSGAVVWATRTGLLEAFLITGGAPDRAIVRRDDTILLFDTETGTLLASHHGKFESLDADHLVVSTTTSDGAGDRIVVADIRTGKQAGAWSLPTDDTRIQGLGSNHLIVEDAGRVLALDLVSGVTAWERPLATRERLRTAGGGTILLQAPTEVTALDEMAGEVRWTVPFDGILSAWHVPGADSLTAATSRNASFELVHFDAATGREVWRTSITDPEPPNLTRVLQDGAVALRWADEYQQHDQLVLMAPREDMFDETWFVFPAEERRNARIVLGEPLIIATDDGLYGLDASAFWP
jgi:outer membrane protein assembly factor BamB